jgi:hypothetical protein
MCKCDAGSYYPLSHSLFLPESLHSYRVAREGNASPDRYFLWSAIRLDSDPLNKHSQLTCTDSQNGCAGRDITGVESWVHPGLLEKVLVVSALPAFVVGILISFSLGKIGVSQVTSFMFVMPLLIFAWFFFVGWLVDRLTFRRSR